MRYVNVENPDMRQYATEDPKGFLREFPPGSIIDEIQRTPHLISYIQTLVDQNPDMGQYILTGSHQFQLLEQVSQSLAGRTFLFRLLPLSLMELEESQLVPSLNQLLYQGCYPRIYAKNVIPSELHQAYFDSYIQKDVRQITNVKDLSLFQRFLSLCAGRTGQILNKESLSSDAGINVKTVEEWLSILEASFVLLRIPPYWTNTRKRLVKSPKIFYFDTGLICWLLNIRNHEDLNTHPLRGQIFENFIMMESMKSRFNRGLSNNSFFYRDSRGKEIDMVLEYGQKAFPIEIKSSFTYQSDFSKNLNEISSEIQLGRAVVYGGEDKSTRSDVEVIPWSMSGRFFGKLNETF